MILEDYVSYETAKLLKEKGFVQPEICQCKIYIPKGGYEITEDDIYAPTQALAMKWLRVVHNLLVIPDYDYECTDKSYCYKIYKLGENGKPERVPIEGVRYDMLGEPHTEIVAYRDYERSYSDYETYEEAAEAGIRYCLENLI